MQLSGLERKTSLVRRLEGADRRRHRRVELIANVRGLNAEGEEFNATALDLCAGGVRISLARPLSLGEEVVLYIDGIGRVEGVVARVLRDIGYAIAFRIPQRKREKIADQLTWLINREPLGLEEDRTSERNPASGEVFAVFGDGQRVACFVQDMSIFGVALKTSGPRPLIGEPVRVGTREGYCARYFDGGFAVDFRRALDGV